MMLKMYCGKVATIFPLRVSNVWTQSGYSFVMITKVSDFMENDRGTHVADQRNNGCSWIRKQAK